MTSRYFRRECRAHISVHLIEPGFFQTNLTSTENIRACLERTWEDAPADVKAKFGENYIEKCQSKRPIDFGFNFDDFGFGVFGIGDFDFDFLEDFRGDFLGESSGTDSYFGVRTVLLRLSFLEALFFFSGLSRIA